MIRFWPSTSLILTSHLLPSPCAENPAPLPEKTTYRGIPDVSLSHFEMSGASWRCSNHAHAPGAAPPDAVYDLLDNRAFTRSPLVDPTTTSPGWLRLPEPSRSQWHGSLNRPSTGMSTMAIPFGPPYPPGPATTDGNELTLHPDGMCAVTDRLCLSPKGLRTVVGSMVG